MQIQVNTDNHVHGGEELTRLVETEVQHALSRFQSQITRVEAQLHDVNGAKHGERDKRCLLEARIAGMQPIAVSDEAGSFEQAVNGAAGKLARTLERTLGKLEEKKGRTSFGGEQKI